MAGGDFTHVEAPHTDHVHVRFTGPFQGRQIVWDARIVTLEYVSRELQSSRRSDNRPGLRQFIEVGRAANGTRMLRIGLNVERIDEPVILKAIIMIRQYKRLREGCHQYGQTWSPARQP